MSALTQQRRGATDGDTHNIVSQIQRLRMEGSDVEAVISALHDALDGSEYQKYGSVDLDDIAGRIGAEIIAHMPDAKYWAERKDSPFYSVVATLDAFTVRVTA